MSSTTGASAPSLQGRTALITGASRGIGRECAFALGAAGAMLVLLGRNTAALTEVITAAGATGTAHRIDLAHPDGVAKTLAEARLDGAPDIIVNNAAEFFLMAAEEAAVEDFQRLLAVNLASPFAIVRAFLGGMKRRGRGHIVTIGSVADHRALAGNASYSASKYGLRGLHEVLRAELRGTGVRATLISPGRVDTAIWDEAEPEKDPDFARRGEMLSAAAVADAVLYAVTRPSEVNVDELRLSRS